MRVCTQCHQKVPAGMPVCPRDGAPAHDPDAGEETMLGKMVGEYMVKGVIGEGGMGQVFEGVQPVIGKRVAIKLLRREIANDPQEAQRLLTEARAVNAIGHRGIIDIFGFGALPDGRQYFVMEYLSGQPLSRYIREFAPLPIDDALKLLDEMLAAVGSAHGAGVIHRDIKPSNIFLVRQPDGSHFVKVLDFGLAKQAAYARGETPQTRISRVLGTPEYMAPEQARAEAVGPRTDLYALGCVLFEMLTGEPPFDAPTPFEIVNKHLNEAVQLPSSLVASVPSEVDDLVLWLMQKDASDRPESAELVRAEVRRLRKTLKNQSTQLVNQVSSMTAFVQPVLTAPSGEVERTEPEARMSGSNPGTKLTPLDEETSQPKETRILPPQASAKRSAPEATRIVSTGSLEPTPLEYSAVTGSRSRTIIIAAVAVAFLVLGAVASVALRPKEPEVVVLPENGPEQPPPPPQTPDLKPEVVIEAPKPPPVEKPPEQVAGEPEKPPEPVADKPPTPPTTTKTEPTPVAVKPPDPPPVKKGPEANAEEKPKPVKVDPLTGRYKRARAAWNKSRGARTPEDRRIFDLMIDQIGKQLGSGARGEATESLNDFVAGALEGKEP
ncbi:MAG: serine/threonine-protein kinase [Myxococcota bacterium]